MGILYFLYFFSATSSSHPNFDIASVKIVFIQIPHSSWHFQFPIIKLYKPLIVHDQARN